MIPWNAVGDYVVDCPNGYDEFFSETTEDPTQMKVTQGPTQIMNVLATQAARRVASKNSLEKVSVR